MLRNMLALLTLVMALSWNPVCAERRTTAPPKNPLYSAIADDVYLQEIGQKVPTDKPVTAVAAWQDEIYAVSEGKLLRLHDGKLEAVEKSPSGLQQLFVLDGKLWGSTADALYLFADDARTSRKVFEGAVVDMCMHNGAVYAATRDEIFRLEDGAFVDIKPKSGWLTTDTTMIMEDGSQVLGDPIRLGAIEQIASYSDTLHLMRPNGLALIDGAILVEEPVDWGAMPSGKQRDMLSHGSRLLIATDRGIAVLRGAALTTITGKDGLPYEDVTCLAIGFDGDLWIVTTTGAIRNTGIQFHYFGAQHWLPADNVHAIVVQDKTAYIATDGGIGIIRYEPYTLRKKAAYFEQNVEAMGHKRLGFVHQLYRDGSAEDGRGLREISDNDGGHTAHYLAAMSRSG